MTVETLQTEETQYQTFVDSNLEAIKAIERQSRCRGQKTSPIALVDGCHLMWKIVVEVKK